MNLRTEFMLDIEGPQSAPEPERDLLHGPRLPFAPSPAATAAAMMQQLIDDLPEEIALLDEAGNILVANKAWIRTVEAHYYLDAMPGGNYYEVCATRAAAGYPPAIEAVTGLDDIMSGKRDSWQLIYNGGQLWEERDYQITIHRIAVAGQSILSVTRHDLTELIELRRLKEDFTNTLIEGQQVERQRMARELHDSTSQMLTAIGLLLGRLRHGSRSPKSSELVEEMRELVTDAQREIRAISYLAHPPALEELGLVAATKRLAEGFGRRAGLQVTVRVDGEALALSDQVEGALYRIAQEALSNVHRHAHASEVQLLLIFRQSAVHLVISDNGVGISDTTLAETGRAGVGLGSMRSRMREIGGRLSVRKLSPGTAIVASVAT